MNGRRTGCGAALARALRAAALACACAGVAQAQTTGTVIGAITDAATGRPIAGATVVARSPSLQRQQTAVADDTGSYRLTLLPPGSYTLSVPASVAPAPGGEATRYEGTERIAVVLANRTVRVDLALAPTSVRLDELVVRTGSAPVVDVGSAQSGAALTRDFLDTVPLARDFAEVAEVAPGARLDRYGVAFGGSTSPENAYLLDGMNVTDPAFGTQGSRLLTTFLEELDVRSAFFLPEHGRATGGIVQAITRSGSNELHGSIFGHLQPGALSPAPRPIVRDAQSIVLREQASQEYRADFGLELGGPVVKDRLWFYVGFAPVLDHLVAERSFQALREDPDDPGHALRDPRTGLPVATRVGPGRSHGFCADALDLDCNRSGYQLLGKLSFLAAEDHQLGLTFTTAPEWREFLDRRIDATESAGVVHDSRRSTDLVGRYAGKLLEKRLLVEAQGGWHHQTRRDDPVTVDGIDQAAVSAVRWAGTHSLRDFFSPEELGDAYAACAPSATFDPCPVSRFVTGGRGFLGDATLDRFSGKLSASGLFTLLGHHQLKAGLELERTSFASASSWGGGVFLSEASSAAYGNTFVDYRDYGRVTSPTDPDLSPDAQRFTSLRVKSVSNSRALFLQDSWSFLDAVTLNVGVRWEAQDMYRAGAGGPANIDLRDSVAPRVQAIWDFTRRGRGAIKASWGRFYESIPLDLGNRQFGGETQILSTRAYCVGPSPTVGGSPARCSRIPDATYNGALGRYTTYAQLGGSVTPVAPDLEGQYVDMFGASIEYEILPDLSAGIFYEGRRLGRVIEDMSADDGGTFFIANPGASRPFAQPGGSCAAPGASGCLDPRRAQTTDPVTGRTYTVSVPKPERRYDAFTIELRKVFSRRWLALVSYRYSILRGNYAGLFNAETGQLDPNILPEYDLVSLLPNRDGPLPGDVPHQLKLFGSYLLPVSRRLSVQAGLALRLQSGTPVSYLGAHGVYGAGQTYILPRGSAGRTPWLATVDLRGRLDWLVSQPFTLTFTVDVFNVLNAQEPVAVDQNYTYDAVQPIVGGSCRTRGGAEGPSPLASAAADCPDLPYLRTTDHRPVTPNPNFGRALQYQQPRAVRLGLAVSF